MVWLPVSQQEISRLQQQQLTQIGCQKKKKRWKKEEEESIGEIINKKGFYISQKGTDPKITKSSYLGKPFILL